WTRCGPCTTGTPAGCRCGLPGGATTPTWWRTRCRTRSSPCGASRGGSAVTATWLWGIAIRRLLSRLRTRTDIVAVFETTEISPAAEDQVLLSVEYGDIGQAL